MIVYPENWRQDYYKYADVSSVGDAPVGAFVELLEDVLDSIEVDTLAYSGGIDSTVMLDILSHFYQAHTFTIASRNEHPDALFAKIGSLIYQTKHQTMITGINANGNVYETFFDMLPVDVTKIICCDGIDEFMCGYYDHQTEPEEKYAYYLGRLTPDHLEALNSESKGVEIYLPYLNAEMIDFCTSIPLSAKVDDKHRKIYIRRVAGFLGIDDTIIDRNKYGFCDAFLTEDK